MVVSAKFITQTPKAWYLELEEGKVWVQKTNAWFSHDHNTLEISKNEHQYIINKINA